VSIVLKDLHKSFGPKSVLEGFSLEIREGETLCIIGQSGAGKSVVLKHVVRLLEPDRGEVWVDGENVGDLSRKQLFDLRRKVGYVFQFAALFDSMTVEENVGLGLRRLTGMTEAEIHDRVEECLGLVDLPGYGERFPAELSGGQKKRAGLARAIATRPKYLLYDEPTTGLDPLTKAVIDELIMRMAEELSVTGVVITHDIESAYKISDRIAMLHEGRVRREGSPEDFRTATDPVVKAFVEGRPELLEASS